MISLIFILWEMCDWKVRGYISAPDLSHTNGNLSSLKDQAFALCGKKNYSGILELSRSLWPIVILNAPTGGGINKIVAKHWLIILVCTPYSNPIWHFAPKHCIDQAQRRDYAY